MPVKVHILAAPADAKHAEQLKKGLVMARRSGLIEFVDGTPNIGDLVLVVLTESLLADDVCEAKLDALKAFHDASGDVFVVLPKEIDILKQEHLLPGRPHRPSAWYENVTRLPHAKERDQNGRPTHINSDGWPVAGWRDADDAWVEIAREVREQLPRLQPAASTAPTWHQHLDNDPFG